MAKGKKSFVLYSDQKELFEQLPDEQAGKLIKHIYKYVNDEDPETDDLLVKVAFSSIKAALKRDLDNWEKQLKQRREAGKRSAEVRRRNSTSVNERSNSLNEKERNPTDNVNDSVNVNVNDNEIKKKIESSFEKFWDLYDKKVDRKKSLYKWKGLKEYEREEIIKITPAYVRANPERKYRKNPVTFFNNRSWEDEIIEENSTIKSNGAPKFQKVYT